MTAAPLASPQPDGAALPAHLPAPFPTRPASAAHRNGVGLGVAVALHLAVLGAVVLATDTPRAPVNPPQPYMMASIVRAEAPTRTPAPPAKAPAQVRKATPEPTPQSRPTRAEPVSRPAITSTPVASNAAGTSAPATPPAAAPVAAVSAPAAVVPPRFDAAYLANPAPPYPSASRKMGEEGRVLLRVQVGADGRPTDVIVARSSGYPRLDEAARDTVLRSWRFVPARQGDQPVAGAVKVPIDFTLSSAP